MSEINTVPEAMNAVNAVRISLDEAGADAHDVKGKLDAAFGVTKSVEEYLEQLAKFLQGHEMPSYDEAVAHQAAEDLRMQLKSTTDILETVREQLVLLAGNSEALARQLANITSR